jgi:pimeloyl-ACP methyl ester carboxylesterase
MQDRMPNASLVVVEETGHAPHFENPARVGGTIAQFLKTL